MASPALPPSSSGGTNTSMWAGQSSPASPAPSRGGWGQSGTAFRGRGGGRGAPRGGRGGGRVASGRGGPPVRSEDTRTKPIADQPKEKPAKAPAAPLSKSVTLSAPKPVPVSKPGPPLTAAPPAQPGSSARGPGRPKPVSRKPSEQKTPRTKAPSVHSEPPTIPITHSPALSTTSTAASRNGGHRKRSNAKPPSRKTSVSAEPSVRSRLDRPSVITTKDVPPHLATAPDTPSFDIKHNIDALVERVRAVAMDRPNTPGSHIDWAGDDDDSLPDLDDWGVTSSTADPTSSEVGTSRIISPILEGTLKPLPSLGDCDDHLSSAIPETEKYLPDDTKGEQPPVEALNKVDEVKPQAAGEASADPNAKSGSESAAVSNNPSISTSPPKSAAKAPLHPSLPPKPAGVLDSAPKRASRRPDPPFKGKESSSDVAQAPQVQVLPPVRISLDSHNPSSKDSSPERGLSASMHAMPTSQSAPSDVTSHTMPHHHISHFNPTHGRAHTVGARIPAHHRQPFAGPSSAFPDHLSDGERPRRGDHAYHARTQSTPPTGPGTATAHARTPHATRPVITVDAISKLARTLGATPLRREAASAGASPTKE